MTFLSCIKFSVPLVINLTLFVPQNQKKKMKSVSKRVKTTQHKDDYFQLFFYF